MNNKSEKNIQTSKKLAWFSGICFAIVLLYSMATFSYCAIKDKSCDFAMLIALITTTGAVFGTTCAFYYTKSKGENLFKIKRSFLKIKYLILKNIDALDKDRIKVEIEKELSAIDGDFDIDEKKIKEDIVYGNNDKKK